MKGHAAVEYSTHPAAADRPSASCVLPEMPGFWGLYQGMSLIYHPHLPQHSVLESFGDEMGIDA